MTSLRRNGCGADDHSGAELASGALVLVPLSDKKLAVDRLRLVARAGAGARPAVEAFLAIARTHLPDGASVR